MAEFLKCFAARALLGAFTLLLSAGACWPVAAESLPDPMRPPAAVPEARNRTAESPVLQSVLVGPHRSTAVIDGQTVAVGERIHGAEVTEIKEGEVTLRTGKHRHKLMLFPQLEKRWTNAGSGMPQQ